MRTTLFGLLVATLMLAAPLSSGGIELAVKGTAFALEGKPTFLMGVSYYSALGAHDSTWTADLDAMQLHGFNWIRVWATWRAFDNDVSAVDRSGKPREPYLSRLKALVAECDRRKVVVDVTIAPGAPGLAGFEPHRQAVETLVMALRRWRNWYLDLANERNIGDARHVPIADVARLRDEVKRLDPRRLVTASHGGDVGREDVRAYLIGARLDFLTPHRPRDAESPVRTEATTRAVLGWIADLGKAAPVHYQEPFRRGYGDWQPRAEDFAADLAGARKGGAAGWCFHNGSTRGADGERPRRSFDLRDGPLFAHLDAEERRFVEGLTVLTVQRRQRPSLDPSEPHP